MNSSLRPKPYLYPIYGLLIGILIALAIVLQMSSRESTYNRNVMLYCVRQNVASAIYRSTLPAKCLGHP